MENETHFERISRNWWDDPTDEELEEEYLSSVIERSNSYSAFAGSYD